MKLKDIATTNMNRRKRIGIFGGTFDPVHIGHLRMALDIKTLCSLDEMILVPCYSPVYRDDPRATDAQRIAMLQLATQDCPDLRVDLREIMRESYTYSFDTLGDFRQEWGDDVSLCFCMGADGLSQLNQWHRWRELTTRAHLIVAARPGWNWGQDGDALPDDVAEFYRTHRGTPADIEQLPAGKIVLVEPRLMDVSATQIRQALATDKSVHYLVPDAVLHYLNKFQLYR